jgi:hypothetical protein
MDEHDWLTSTDPRAMLDCLRGRASSRKFRLFAAACCRQVWDLLGDETAWDAIDRIEMVADGLKGPDRFPVVVAGIAVRCLAAKSEAQVAALWAVCAAAHFDEEAATAGDFGADDAVRSAHPAARLCSEGILTDPDGQATQARLLRCIFGNPFRPVTADTAWLTPTVVALAHAAYDQRLLPSGELDRDRLLVLADALEEVGGGGDLLDHLRLAGPHTRGCWAVDALLGRA